MYRQDPGLLERWERRSKERLDPKRGKLVLLEKHSLSFSAIQYYDEQELLAL